MKFDINQLEWIYPPKQSFLSAEKIVITTDPLTDCWQRTHYGFQKDNAHALVLPLKEDFCFTFKASFVYGAQYDQCLSLIHISGTYIMMTSLSLALLLPRRNPWRKM